MADPEKIALSDVAFAYVKPLYGSHKVGEAFDGRELPADPNRDSIIDELKDKGVATRGGGRYWKLTLKVPVTQLTGGGDAAAPRARRAPAGGTRPRRAPAGATQLTLDSLESGAKVGGATLIKDADLEHIRTNFRAYANATTAAANREWHRNRGAYIEAEKKKALALNGDAFFDRMEALSKERHMTFPEALEAKYGKIMVMLLGVPEPGPDTPDEKTPRKT